MTLSVSDQMFVYSVSQDDARRVGWEVDGMAQERPPRDPSANATGDGDGDESL
jgi:hypothetical protein